MVKQIHLIHHILRGERERERELSISKRKQKIKGISIVCKKILMLHIAFPACSSVYSIGNEMMQIRIMGQAPFSDCWLVKEKTSSGID
jgi:hypothetical protein